MRRAVLVICDSLRRDLITEATAPTLAALAPAVANFASCSAVFPSVTRVTSACIATGCRPASHGLLGNNMVLDEGDGLICLSAGKPEFRERIGCERPRSLCCKSLSPVIDTDPVAKLSVRMWQR